MLSRNETPEKETVEDETKEICVEAAWEYRVYKKMYDGP